MLYKNTQCPKCHGRGVEHYFDYNSVCSGQSWCKNCSGKGLVTVPVTNGDLIRRCTNEQLVHVWQQLHINALYSGGVVSNRLLSDTSEDWLLWFNKAADDLDIATIFDFIDRDDFVTPTLEVHKE